MVQAYEFWSKIYCYALNTEQERLILGVWNLTNSFLHMSHGPGKEPLWQPIDQVFWCSMVSTCWKAPQPLTCLSGINGHKRYLLKERLDHNLAGPIPSRRWWSRKWNDTWRVWLWPKKVLGLGIYCTPGLNIALSGSQVPFVDGAGTMVDCVDCANGLQ